MEKTWKWRRENYNLYQAQIEADAIPFNVNRAGTYYKYLINDIERRWNVTL